ncbi:hypothetical protein COCON_G00099720 [Conger conger]|uniref:Rho-GAP domain-containing protein n=1 Tax=Conger conger TaxID=82655 RepID=A0A9Q1I1J5_CONCO|nr:hypothetical protein COCON_G00099720 [Conger conger]
MRRGSYDDAVASLRPHLQNLAHRRRSAPSLAFSRALGKTWTPIREEGLGQVPANQSPFVLGLTNENAELTLDERVQLTEGQKTKERQLFLFSDILVIAKLKASSSSYRLKHRVNLEQLWIVSFEDEEDEEDEEGDAGINLKASLFLAWPLAQCVVSFRSPEVKERWLDTLHRKIREATERSGSPSPLPTGLMTVLSGSVTCKTLGGVMDSVIEVPTDGKASAAQKAEPLGNEEGRGCHPIEKMGGGWRHFLQRKRSSAHSDSGPAPREPLLFSQPLSKVCGGDGQLPQPITDMLMLLLKKGVFTEGVFRKAANARSLKEIRELLNSGTEVELESKPVILLAALLKDFLRQIPGSLLVAEEYAAWMATLETKDLLERRAQLRQVIDRLPLANGVLLQHLLCVLHHISRNTTTNKMDANNLSICIGPNLLQHSPEPEVVSKVTDLTQFLIENCCEIFGSRSSLFSETQTKKSLLITWTRSPLTSTTLRTTARTPTQRGTPPVTTTTCPSPSPAAGRSPPSSSPPSPPAALSTAACYWPAATRTAPGSRSARSRSLRPRTPSCGRRRVRGQPRPLSGAAGAGSPPLPARWRAPSPTNQRAPSSPARRWPLPRPPGGPRSPGSSPYACRPPRRPPRPPQETEKEEKVKRRSQSMRSRGMARVRSWSTFTRGGSLKKADAPSPKRAGPSPARRSRRTPPPRPRPRQATPPAAVGHRGVPGGGPQDSGPAPFVRRGPPAPAPAVPHPDCEWRQRAGEEVSPGVRQRGLPAAARPGRGHAHTARGSAPCGVPPPGHVRVRIPRQQQRPHDEANRRCSQPLFEEMLYAKESYV